jgi:uncharacterized protein (DUF1501 family)
MFDRRELLKISASAALTASLTSVKTVFAAPPTDARFVLVFLRGAMDGLHALAPYADPLYAKLRPKLALKKNADEDSVIDLDGYFGVHPSLKLFADMYQNKELVFMPAVATQYRKRSHFDGQNFFENGSGRPFGARDGWLNRSVLQMSGGDARLGLSVGSNIPFILQGDAPVQTWGESPFKDVDEDFLKRLEYAYQDFPDFRKALQNAQMSPAMSEDMSGGKKRQKNKDFLRASRAVSELLARPDGPRVAVMELGGWDTHFGQNFRLKQLFSKLSEGTGALRDGLAPVWDKTVIMIASEFGRTAAENGSQGTDHGTGGLSIIMGGNVAGGKIVGDWPGLDHTRLYEKRDLAPTNSMEALSAILLRDHLKISEKNISDAILPRVQFPQNMANIIRNA